MLNKHYLTFLFITLIQEGELIESNKIIGIDSVHNVKIDKDTIITRNMKLNRKLTKTCK